jgi:2-polyprenyl-3-methyl-5-hydroxy-6-metoxy-1,4-benzoquinol methylase
MSLYHKIYHYQKNQGVIDLIPNNTKKILDLGCGTGVIANFIDKNVVIHGITISEQEYKIAKDNLNKVFVFNLENGLPDEIDCDYDLVIASHILEHIAYPDKLLQDIKKVLNTNGKLIVALPNIMHYSYRLKLMIGNFNYTETGVMDQTHLRWYTFYSAKKLLSNHGFHVEYSGVTSELPLYSILKILPKAFQVILKRILYKISRGLFGMQLLYVACTK